MLSSETLARHSPVIHAGAAQAAVRCDHVGKLRRMKQVLCVAAMLVLIGPAISAAADEPPGVVLLEARTAPVGTPDAVERKVSQRISYGHEGFKVRRGANGPAETHADHSHSLVVQSGRGTVVLGGRVVDRDGRAASPNAAGTSLRDGTECALSTGAWSLSSPWPRAATSGQRARR